MGSTFHCFLFASAIALASSTSAQVLPVVDASSTVWLAASDQELAQMRGGFNFGGGLTVSFGVTRETYLNGLLVATTTLQLNDLWQATKGTGTVPITLPANAFSAQLVQNGPGNVVDPVALQLPLATYIQNTLNNQSIRNQTLIDVSTNSMGLLRGIQLNSTIRESSGNVGLFR